MSSTLTHEPKHTSASPVKSKSGFWRALFGRDADQADEFLFTDERTPIQRSAATVTQPYRGTDSELNDDLDRVGLNLIGLSSLHIRDKWTAIQYRDAIEEHLAKLDDLVAREKAGGRKLLERKSTAAAAPQQVAEVIQAAVKVEVFTGVPTSLDTDVLGSGMTALTVNSHRLTDETMHGLPRITPGMRDPRLPKLEAPEVTQVLPSPMQFPPFGQDSGHAPHPEVAEPESPVHAPEDPAPVPPGRDREPTPLPQRRPVTSFQAVMVGEPGDAALRDGTLMVAKRLVEGFEGAWLLAEDGENWVLIADVSISNSAKTVYVKLANGRTVEVAAAREVPVLSADEAKALLAQDAQVSA